MARLTATNFSGALQFPYATAGSDQFQKEDVQVLAQAVDQHNHTTGKGLPLTTGSIPNGTITSAMIADGTITGTDIASGTITTTQIQDGTIATADLANAAVTNAKLGTDTARLNLLTNGGFEIWQRGNGPFAAGNAYSADRWFDSLQPGTSISKDTTNTDNSAACMAVTTTSATTNAAPSQVWNQGILDRQQYKNKVFSASVRVRTSVANAVRLVLWDGTTATYGAYHTGNGQYQTLTVTATPTGATLDLGVNIEAAGTHYLDNAMLVVGSVPADYAPLHPADDLARCLRYYERQSPELTSVATGASQNLLVAQPFRVPKPVTPTLTVGGSWTATNCSATPSVGQRGGAADSFYYLVSSTASGPAGIYPSGSPAGFISIEANP